jgi:hypothetical protein
MFETIFFSVQVCVNPWTVLRQADLQMYLFGGREWYVFMFLCEKNLPVNMALWLEDLLSHS